MKTKEQFIHQLAEFIAGNSAAKSIMLEVETKTPRPYPMPNFAKEWAVLASSTPVRGWVSVEEAEKILREFLL